MSRSIASKGEQKLDKRQGKKQGKRRNTQNIQQCQTRHLYWLAASSTYNCLLRLTM